MDLWLYADWLHRHSRRTESLRRKRIFRLMLNDLASRADLTNQVLEMHLPPNDEADLERYNLPPD